MLTVLMPVTRPWSLGPVCDAIGSSDVPRERLVLLLDAPDCEPWADALSALGFAVETHATGNPQPPEGRRERRARHRDMRRLTQTLVPDGPLLCLEDDTIVPADVFSRLSAAGPNATGVQVGRYERRIPGVRKSGVVRGTGVEPIDSCGHYCLLTTGEAYKAARICDSGAVDVAHTEQIRPLVVDWECKCGHLLSSGAILWPR